MRATITQILLFFCLTGNITYSQRTISLKIDTSCFSSNEIPEINGTLGLYTNFNALFDTLIQDIEIINEQEIVIETADNRPSSFKLIFTPTDTMLPKNQYNIDQYMPEAYLSCYFFNSAYPSFIDHLDENDTLFISSSYLGYTGPLTPMTTHFLMIWRFEHSFYASFITRARYPNVIWTPEEHNEPFGDSILLTTEHLKVVKAFEANIENLVEKQYNLRPENTFTTIITNDNTIYLYTKGYLSLMMWNELNKTTANKK